MLSSNDESRPITQDDIREKIEEIAALELEQVCLLFEVTALRQQLKETER